MPEFEAALEELRRRSQPAPDVPADTTQQFVPNQTELDTEQDLELLRNQTSGQPGVQVETPRPAPKPLSSQELATDSLQNNLRHAAGVNPQEVAQRRKLANDLGVPKELLPDGPEAQEQLFLKKNDAAELMRSNPEIAAYLQDLDNAEVAGQDIGTLKKVSSLMRRFHLDPLVAAAKTTVAVPQTLAGIYKIYDRAVMSLIPDSVMKAVDDATPQAIREGLGNVEDQLAQAGIRLDFKQTQEFIDKFYSPETRAAKEAVAKAEGFFGTLGTALENPSAIATAIGESVGPMLLGGATAQVITKAFPAISPLVAGAAGEGVTIAGGTAQQITEETGEALTGQQALISAGTGVLGAGIGILGAKIAQKLGVGDLDTALARGSIEGAMVKSQVPAGLAKRILVGGGIEGMEELGQSGIEQIAQNIATEKPWNEGVPEAMAMGLLTGGAMGGTVQAFTPKAPEEGLNRDIDDAAVEALRNVAHAQQAEENKQTLEEFSKSVAESSLRANSPEEFKKFIRTMADEGEMIQEVYVDAAKLDEAFAQSGITPEELREKMPEVAKELALAKEVGSEVRISFDDYATHIAGSKAEVPLLDHLRTTPEGMTYAESQQFFQGQEKQLTEQAKEILETHQPVLSEKEFKAQEPEGSYQKYLKDHKNKAEVFAVDTKNVHQNILDGLNATGRFTKDINAVYAVPFREFYATAAAKEGILPSELYERMPLNFKNVRIEDGLLDQSAIEWEQQPPLTADEVDEFSKALQEELGVDTLFMFPDNQGNLRLESLIINKDRRGEGVGSAVMERITEYADARNVRLTLTPAVRDDFQGTTSRSRLVKFYKRFGFVENKGRNKDFSIMEGMYRPIKRPQLGVRDATQEEFTGRPGGPTTISGIPPLNGFEEQTKIRGRDGQPLTVFRGSDAGLQIDHFKKEALGFASGAAPSGRGVHFTTRKSSAAAHGDVREFQLDIRNPFVFKADDPKIPSHDTAEEYFEWREGLRAKGFDGIVEIASHLGGPNNIIAFDPEQVILKQGVFHQFAGVRSDTADTFQLGRAIDLEAQGLDKETIRLETGWFRGIDRKWRYEIDDSKATLKPIAEGKDTWLEIFDSTSDNITLGDLVNHPRLYAAYPALQDVVVSRETGRGASLIPSTEHTPAKVQIGDQVPVGKVLNSLMHEVQHALQEIEGFAFGTNIEHVRNVAQAKIREAAEAAKPVMKKIDKEVFDISERFINGETEAIARVESAREKHKGVLGEGKPPSAYLRLEMMSKEPTAANYLRVLEENKEAQNDPFNVYMRSAGEIEARNVETRLTLNEESRRGSPPESTQDIPSVDAIVQFKGGVSSSLPPPANMVESTLQQSAFFSALEREIGGLKKVANKQGMVKPEQAIKWIEARQKEGKFKQAEAEAVGLLDWLSATKDPVSVADVETFVLQNGVQLEDTVLEGDETLFSGYVLPAVDGDNRQLLGSYKEFLLRIPSRGTDRDFVGEHFDQENIVAHVRLDERTDELGNRILFLEEIQSDWAQKGRKAGFKKDKDIVRLNDLEAKIKSKYNVKIPTGRWSQKSLTDAGVPLSVARAYHAFNSSQWSKVATGPMLEDTKAWTALAFKRMLRYAVDGGFDKIAWTTGQQQVNRYGMDEQVGAIKELNYKRNTDGTYDLDVLYSDQVRPQALTSKEEDLGDLLTGPIADFLIEGLGTKNPDGTFKLDEAILKEVQGSRGGGMLKYYDNIVPQVISGVMKKLKGPKVSRTSLEDGTTEQPSIEITEQLREKVMQGLPLFQQPEQQIRAAYDPTNFTISLLKGADLSSVIHEGGHFYLEALADMAGQPNAVQQVKDDFRTTLNWFGINGDNPEGVWNMMTLEQKRQYHEQWAQSFERYNLEGKAPTTEMQPVFARFRAWMLQVYKSMKEFLKQNPLAGRLNDDIRQVFDRMLAADDAIKATEKAREYAPLFPNAEAAGVTPEEFQKYMEAGQKATSIAVDELTSRSLRDMKWLSNAKDRAIKSLQKEADAQRKVIREQVETEVMAEPINLARRLIRKGELVNQDGTVTKVTEHKLNTEDVKDLRPGMKLVGSPLAGMTKPGGLNPDLAAQFFGFDSGDALLEALLTEETAKEKIDGITDQRMLQEHGDLVDPTEIKRAAEKAIHNEARARFMATGLRLLSKKVGAGMGKDAVNQMARAAKVAAETAISQKKVRELSPAQFEAAETKANREAIKRAAKDPKKALEAQRAALLNNRLARAASEAKDEVDSALRYLKKFDSPNVRKQLTPDHLEQIDDLRQNVDTRKGITNKQLDKRKSLQDWIDEQEANGFEPAIDPAVMDDLKRKHYKEMTVEELRGLVDSIKQIEHIARRLQKVFTARDKRKFQELVDDAWQSIEDNANRTVPERGTPTDVVGVSAKWARRMAAEHRKFNSIIREMDGGKDNGKMWNLLSRGMNEAGDLETEMKQVATDKISELFAKLPKEKVVPGNIYSKKKMIPGTNLSMTQEQRIMFGMNWGNAGNRQRLLDGGMTGQRAISSKEADKVLDTLSKEEWDFIQGVWDYIATYKPQVAALEKKLTGVEPEWVEATPIKTKFGTYRGGYFPAKYDTELSTRSESLEAATDLRMGMKGAFGSAATRSGYTKARSDEVKNRPLLLSYNVISQHVSEVTHRLSWQPWLIDANRLLKALDAPIRKHYGPEILKELRDTAVDIAQGDAPAKNATEQAINRLRTGSTIVGLGWRVSTAILQFTGITQSMARIGSRWAAVGVGKYVASPIDSAKFANEKSRLMRDRSKTMNREINEILNTIRAGEKVSAFTATYFTMIGKMQRIVDLPTWHGAYEKALHQLKYENALDEKARKEIEDHAVALADQAVIDSQSGGHIKDLAKIQRGSPAWKLFTNFYSYFSAAYNLNIEAVRRTNFKSPSEVGLFAVDMMLINTVPTVMATALALAMKGGCDWEDIECIGKKLAQDQLGHFMGQMILLREMGAAISVATGGDGYGYQGPAGLRFFSDLYKAGTQINQGEADMPLFKAVNSTAGAILHYPAGQINSTVDGIRAIERGEVEGIQILPALISGPPRD